jgi:acetyltransferase-like isoleucine patch superfamily enzyme
MGILNRLIDEASRVVLGKSLSLRRVERFMDVDPSAKLRSGFSVQFMVSPEQRTYVAIGEKSLLSARIVFESRSGQVSIGKRTYIGDCTMICRERIVLGDDVTIAWGVTLYDHNSHSLDWRQRAKVNEHFYNSEGVGNPYSELDWTGVKSAPIVIEDRVWIGFNVVVLKGVRIGEGAIVGACSTVTRDVEPFTIVGGSPATKVGSVERLPA